MLHPSFRVVRNKLHMKEGAYEEAIAAKLTYA